MDVYIHTVDESPFPFIDTEICKYSHTGLKYIKTLIHIAFYANFVDLDFLNRTLYPGQGCFVIFVST